MKMNIRLIFTVCVCVILAGVLIARPLGQLKVPPGCRPAEGTTAEPYTGSGFAKEVIHLKSGIRLLFVPAGKLIMGPMMGDPYGSQLNVNIAKPFYMGKYEVTNAEFKKFVSATGYDGKADSDSYYHDFLNHFRGESIMPTGDDFPVVWVNWKHAKAYCGRAGLRLPSEAEWEYACRTGTTTAFSFGDDPSEFVKYGWYTVNSEASPHEVGKKLANNWGFYDMHGNVWEWCEDDFVLLGYEGVPTDGSAYVAGKMTKVLRGGAWDCRYRSASRAARFRSGPTNASNNTGFRVVLDVE